MVTKEEKCYKCSVTIKVMSGHFMIQKTTDNPIKMVTFYQCLNCGRLACMDCGDTQMRCECGNRRWIKGIELKE